MIGNLFKFIGGLPSKTIKKADIEMELEGCLNNIRLNILPLLTSIREKMVPTNNIKLSDISFFRSSIIEKEYVTVSGVLIAINNVANQLEDKKKDIMGLLKNIPNTLSTKAMTTDQALLLNVLDNIKLYVEMSSDILVLISEKYNDQESVFAPAVLKTKKELLYDYYNVLNSYSDMKNTITDLGNIVITNSQAVETMLADSKINIPNRMTITKGFIGNPWYHLSILFVNYNKGQISKTLKNKEYVELLLAEFEIARANQYDPKLDKLIENSKNEINAYELKLEKLRYG